MKLINLKRILRKAWGNDTCYPLLAKKWTSLMPELGQCAVTALIVQDFFKGSILYCKHHDHYWNKLPDGREVDFTRKQFGEDGVICFDEACHRKQILNLFNKEAERYKILKERVKKLLKDEEFA